MKHFSSISWFSFGIFINLKIEAAIGICIKCQQNCELSCWTPNQGELRASFCWGVSFGTLTQSGRIKVFVWFNSIELRIAKRLKVEELMNSFQFAREPRESSWELKFYRSLKLLVSTTPRTVPYAFKVCWAPSQENSLKREKSKSFQHHKFLSLLRNFLSKWI